jgi:methyl-accepting chemotaxis protein
MEFGKKTQVKDGEPLRGIQSKFQDLKNRIPALSNNTTIRYKLILSFLVPIVFIIILGLVSYHKAAEGLRSSYEYSTVKTIHMACKYLEFGLDSAEAVSVQYQNDDSIKKYLMGIDKDDIIKSNNTYKMILNSISAKEMTDVFISNISLLSDHVASVTTLSAVDKNICAGFYATEAGKMVENSINTVWLGRNEYLDEKLNVGAKDYSLRLVKKAMGSEALVVIDIDKNKTLELLSDIEFDQTGTIGIVTADGKEMIAGKDKNASGNTFIGTGFYEDAAASEAVSGAYYVDYQGKKGLFIYSKVAGVGAMICAVIPKSTIVNQADHIKRFTAIIVLIACVIAVLTGILISNGIDKTIKYIIAKIKKVSGGDLTIKLNTKRRDEFRVLMDEMNHAFLNTKDLVGQVKDLGEEVSEASVNVSDTSNKFVASTEDISHAMNEIEKGIVQQARDAEECLVQMDRLSNKIISLNENSHRISDIAEDTRKNIAGGTLATSRLNDQTKAAKEITADIVGEIESLAEKSESIDSITNVISTISSQINLLSLNASIEAARAGEYGKGFAVVAAEIRKLADQTRASVNDIKSIIKGIQENTRNTVLTAKKAENVMLGQDLAVKNTTDSYQNINASVDKLMINLHNITENVGNIEVLRTSTLGAIENISAVLEEIAASTNNVNQTSADQQRYIELLKRWSGDLSNNSGCLVQAIQRFTV